VLEDDGVIDHSKTFVAEVVTDDSVQRTGESIMRGRRGKLEN